MLNGLINVYLSVKVYIKQLLLRLKRFYFRKVKKSRMKRKTQKVQT